MSDTRSVWISQWALTTLVPQANGQLRFHAWSSYGWTRTRCGRPLRDKHGHERGVAIRRDTAELIADPCITCWRGR